MQETKQPTRNELLYVQDNLGRQDLSQSCKSSPSSPHRLSLEENKSRSVVGLQIKTAFKCVRGIARKAATLCLCRAHFNPRYVWKNGIIGGVRNYVGVDDEHEESWTGLFVDLIYVAMCSKIAHIFLQCELNFELLFMMGILMHVFFFSRFFLDEYNIRFESDDLFHRFLTFLYIFGVCIMLVNINVNSDDGGGYRRLDFPIEDGSLGYSTMHSPMEQYSRYLGAVSLNAKPTCSLDGPSFSAFASGFYVTRSALFLLYLGMMLIDQSHRVFYMFCIRLLMFLLSIALIIIADTVVVNVHYKMIPVFGAIFCEFLGYCSGGIIVMLKKANKWKYLVGTMYFPINYLIAQQRIGIYILVVLGESMLMLLTPAWNLHVGSKGYMAIVFSLLLVFMFAMQYFDQVVKGKSEIHAARRDIVAGYAFFMLHGPLGLALLVVSSSIFTLGRGWDNQGILDSEDRKVLCWSCFSAGLLMQIMRLLHKGIAFHFTSQKRTAHVVYRFVVISLHLCMLFVDMKALETTITHAMLAFVPVSSDIFFRYMRGDEEINAHRQRRATMAKISSQSKNSGLGASENSVAMLMASGAPLERKRTSILSLQAYNPAALHPTPTRVTSANLKKIDENESGDTEDENHHDLTEYAEAAGKLSTPNRTNEVNISSSEENHNHLPSSSQKQFTLLSVEEGVEEDDTMDESKHQMKSANARKRASQRLSQNKGSDNSDGASQWCSIDGETEEERAESEVFILSDGHIDNEFYERYSEASEVVRRMSMTNMNIEELLQEEDRKAKVAAHARLVETLSNTPKHVPTNHSSLPAKSIPFEIVPSTDKEAGGNDDTTPVVKSSTGDVIIDV